MFFRTGVLRNFAILTEKHLCWSLFIKKRLQHIFSPVNIAKFLKTAFFIEHLLVAASELKSNVSNANLHKSKKKLLLYFDNSHANQTNTTKKI